MANGMNRPGVTINWFDQSTINNPIEETIVRPLFLQLFTSDKGPENLRTIHGDDFFKLYGNKPSFKKHGQPLLQAAQIIKAGGELLCKRVVAEDACLANFVVVAKVVNEKVQKTNAAGAALYINAETGKETTDSASGLNEKAMINAAKITYDAVSVKGAKSMSEIYAYATTLIKDELEADPTTYTGYEDLTKVGDALTDQNKVGQVRDSEDPDFEKFIYPLFIVADNGRGVSSKRFRITPDYVVSKANTFSLYKLNYIGETESENEYVWFTYRDDIIYLDKSMALSSSAKELKQIQAASIAESIDLFVKRLANITGVNEDELKSEDLLFGKTRKGESIPHIVIDQEGYDLSSSLGMMLAEGDNGSFGDAPFNASTYGEEMIKVLVGEYDSSIYDRDMFMIDVCVDANYPIEVKQRIADLAKFREDFVYLRDLGTGLGTYETMLAEHLTNTINNRFVAEYAQSWDVMDPYTKKQITVTAPYSMATKLVSHLIDKRSAPLCGILHGFTFPEVIEGTVSFIPKFTPNVDQKALMADANINYASYVNGVLTMETCFTTEEGRKQTRYINNILSVTKLIHNIRTECPKLRYAFISDSDLEKYREDVNSVIMRSANDFAEVYMEYVQDEIMAANKIFEASIFVRHNNFEQEEIFNIYTLGV